MTTPATGWQKLVGHARSSLDAPFRRRLVTTGHLLSGSAASAAFGLAAAALTARALGPFDYGVLALALTFVHAVERFVTFQSWQPLIRYGATLDPVAQKDDLRSLLKFGLMLDILGALAAAAVAVAIVLIGAPWFGWSNHFIAVVLVCCTVLPFSLGGTPTAVLRIFGHFRVAAYGPALGTLVRVLLCAAGLVAGFDLIIFAAIWTGTQAIGALALLATAFRVLRQHGVTNVLGASLSGVTTRFEGIWGFAWSTNLSLGVRSSANQLDVLIVGALAGPAAAGLYHIAKRVGKLAEQATAQIQTVFYPDAARMWAAGETSALRLAVMQVEWLVFGFGAIATIILWFIAEPLLRLTAGPAFVTATPLLIVQMIAVTIMMMGSASRSALLAMGRQRQALHAVLLGTAAFHVSALLLVPQIGAMGANIAHIIMGTIVAGLLVIDFRRQTRTGPAL